MRRETGRGTISANVSPPTAKTVGQLVMHIASDAPMRSTFQQGISLAGVDKGVQWLGDWLVVRFDDSPAYAKVAALAEQGWGGDSRNQLIEAIFQMPITLGVQICNPLVFVGMLTALRTSAMNALPGAITWEPMEPAYKGVKIVRIQATKQGLDMIPASGEAKKEPFLPAIYYALVDGAWYISLQEQPIKDMIDRAEARKKQPADAKAEAEARRVNSALYVSPAAATAARDYTRGYLAKEVHQRALANEPIWYAFQKAGLLNGKDNESNREAVLFNYLGYVPVSPDGSAYLYDPRTDEMTNARHGSLRRPTPKPALDADSPLGRLLDTTRDIDADLRFREDGVHTTVTIRRQK